MRASIWKCLAHHVPRPYYVSFSYGKTPYNHGNPNTKHSPQGKIPTVGGSRFTTHHYINTRPPLSSGTLKIPNSLTKELIEISHSLTWPSKGFWPIPHQCLLLIFIVLIHTYPLEWLRAYNLLTILAHHQSQISKIYSYLFSLSLLLSTSLSLS